MFHPPATPAPQVRPLQPARPQRPRSEIRPPAAAPAEAAGSQLLRKRNAQLLGQLERSRDEASRLRWRNALVTANLPLARSVASRMRPPRGGSQDDLLQVASLGLIRAVESFDRSRAVNLSSFAVPYMRGALLHEQRDREPLVRIPRSLWDLRQQANQLQERRRSLGQADLAPALLARRLGCRPEQLIDLEGLASAACPTSLDAPLAAARAEGSGGEAISLLEALADPRSLAPLGEPQGEPIGVDDPTTDAGEGGWAAAELVWLRQQLAALDPMRRELVEGRLNQTCTWVELGQRLGLHPRMAQRRCDATLAELRRAAEAWRAGGALSPGPQPPTAGPAAPRSGSGDR